MPRQVPAGGKRAALGTGRTRSAAVYLRLEPDMVALWDALAVAEQVNRTVILERALRQYARRVLAPDVTQQQGNDGTREQAGGDPRDGG